MPNQIQLTPTATVIMLPQDATGVHIAGNVLCYNHQKQVDLPQGNYQLHQNAFDVSDDVAKGIVEVWEHHVSYLGTCYENYLIDTMYCNTALESYHSLLKSKGVYAVNPYGEKPAKYKSINPRVDAPHTWDKTNAALKDITDVLIDKWQTAQLTTGRWVLIIKN